MGFLDTYFMIIISDIHGRTYWKTALKECGAISNEKLIEDVIFMGDYVDHYPYEPDPMTKDYITSESEFENFKEIINFKKENLDKVTLLLGNHDMEYISSYCVPCRMNTKYRDDITKLFKDNLTLFKIGTYVQNGEKLVTFTHANICPTWVESLKELEYDFLSTNQNGTEICKDVIDTINDLLARTNEDESLIDKIGRLVHHIGHGRGGDCFAGSIVWSDLGDYLYDDYDFNWTDVYQVVAHTQHIVQTSPYYRFVGDDKVFCTDCHIGELGNRVAFRLENTWDKVCEDANIKSFLRCVYVVK